MRAIYLLAVLATLVLSSACRSSSHKLDDLLREQRYAEGRALLEAKRVGADVADDADADSIALRQRFTADIEASTMAEVEGLLNEGATHLSYQLTKVRAELCPWSKEIAALLGRCEGYVEEIRSLESRWSPLLEKDDANVEDARRYLEEIAESRPWIMDSPQIRGFETNAINAIIVEWSGVLRRRDAQLSGEEAEAMQVELERIGSTDNELLELARALSVARRLPHGHAVGVNLSEASLEALRDARAALGKDGRAICTSRLAPCVDAIWDAHERWMALTFAEVLKSAGVAYAELEEAEQWVDSPVHGPAIREALAVAHVTLAERRAPQGTAAALALIHLDRARRLGLSSSDGRHESAEQLAVATLANTPRTEYRLDVQVGHKVAPEIRGLVLSELVLQLGSPDDSLAALNPQSDDPELPRLVVVLDEAELIWDVSKLKSINSRYFSHYETVANPYKAILERQLSNAEWDVDSKERSYRAAVNSHNAWPTQSSLNTVNWAYTSYSMAVNNYNSIVGLYNATPATTSQPVYLPYTFRQGTIRFGWAMALTIRVGEGEPIAIRRESVESDFVRLGNDGGDEVEAYRVMDALDMDVSAEASLRHLSEAVQLIKSEMMLPLGSLMGDSIAVLEPEEMSVLRWIYHPWGVQKDFAARFGVPYWAQQAASLARLRPNGVVPPRLDVPESPAAVAVALDPESAARNLSSLVCQVRSSGKQIESAGTGTLIAPEGLVLTCAHVLSGPEIELEFEHGLWRGSYAGELVFVNVQRDVALVRALGLKNDHWAAVRHDQPVGQGEAIVAFGNAAMGTGGQNRGGMSAGIISNPRLTRGEDLHIAVDIAVAQGSSGGPLFSLKDGALVGVVQAVATRPGIPNQGQGPASSGFLCLAAPASMLSEWLGLRWQGGSR